MKPKQQKSHKHYFLPKEFWYLDYYNFFFRSIIIHKTSPQ